MKHRMILGTLALLFCLLACSPAGVVRTGDPELLNVRYEPNGAGSEAVTVSVPQKHLRFNTAQGDLFLREGYTQTGWNTEPDGSGIAVGLGSRTDPQNTTLYAQWAKWSDAALFRVENGTIVAYTGTEDCVVVPGEWNGMPIYAIGENAFQNCSATTVILPPSLKTVAFGAFTDAAVETLYLSDNLQSISDYSFRGCDQMKTLHINAATPPVYSGSYYATFADKYDRLLSLAEQPKIVLFSGSSARFGYDSAAIDKAFPQYEVVNMGVFAYTNALPQLELIRQAMRPRDVLLLSPELDAAKRQFCTTNALDAPFFNLIEADYDLLAGLPLDDFELVFSSFSEYLSVKHRMEPRSYADSPAEYDEDGAPVLSPSYNAYGDYIVDRPNADSDAPLYDLPVPYTASYYRKDLYIDPLNSEIARFSDSGVTVYVTYSPRNRLAVSEDSTETAIKDLDRYFRTYLSAPVISDIFDSLVDGKYLNGTDNHLSTEGVQLRTSAVIRDLKAQMVLEGLLPPEASPCPVIPFAWWGILIGTGYGLAALLVLLGRLVKRWPLLQHLAGVVWAATTVFALVVRAKPSVLLLTVLCMLLLLTVGKRGERA